MTDQELKDLVASLAIQSAKTDAQLAKTDAQLAETDSQLRAMFQKSDEKLDRIGKMVGGISNNQGDIAEEFFYNSIKDNPTLAGINYDYSYKNVTKKVGSIEDEYDILLVNGKDIAIIEVKYKTHDRDIERLLTKKYTNFKKLYPEYKNYNHHLVIASFYIGDNLKNSALDNNITVLQRKGDIIETSLPNNS